MELREHAPKGGWDSILRRWASGVSGVKMKIGRHPADDLDRVFAARQAIDSDAELFVDANGAYTRKQALAFAEASVELGMRRFEEPVSSDNLEGLRLLRDRAPAGMDIAAGEYGYDLYYFRRMLEAGAVDVLQADVTRYGGVSGFLRVAALCQAHGIPLSAHTAPALHGHPCCSLAPVCHVEYFHDHVRIGHLLFDGAPTPLDGILYPDLSRPAWVWSLNALMRHLTVSPSNQVQSAYRAGSRLGPWYAEKIRLSPAARANPTRRPWRLP